MHGESFLCAFHHHRANDVLFKSGTRTMPFIGSAIKPIRPVRDPFKDSHCCFQLQQQQDLWHWKSLRDGAQCCSTFRLTPSPSFICRPSLKASTVIGGGGVWVVCFVEGAASHPTPTFYVSRLHKLRMNRFLMEVFLCIPPPFTATAWFRFQRVCIENFPFCIMM